VGRLVFLGLAGVLPISISTQHTLKKANLLGSEIDRLLSLWRLGDRTAGFKRCRRSDGVGERSSLSANKSIGPMRVLPCFAFGMARI
jgi:hypothetical protein